MSSITTRAGKGSELSHTELDDNFTNLNTDKIENITGESLSDLTDVNATAPTDGQALAWNNATSKWTAQTVVGSGGGGDVVDDTTPQLGGNLDVQNNVITTTGTRITIGDSTNKPIRFQGDSGNQQLFEITPNWTTTDSGRPNALINTKSLVHNEAVTKRTITLSADDVASGIDARVEIQVPYGGGVRQVLNVSDAGVKIEDAYTLPTADGTANQVIETDGAGTLTWVTPINSQSELTDLTNVNLTVPEQARYWRIYSTDTIGADIGMRELEMRESIGGADVTGSGTASAHDASYWTAASAFDNSMSTMWGGHKDANGEGWLKYDFGVGVTKGIAEIVMYSGVANGDLNPRGFKVEWSNDDSTWTTVFTITGEPNWADFQTRAYSGFSSTTAGQKVDEYLIYNGTKWVNLPALATPIESISNVTVTSPVTDHALNYNGTKWVNQLNSVDNLSNVVFTSVADADVLTYDSGTLKWINAPVVAPATPLAASTDVVTTILPPASRYWRILFTEVSQNIDYDGVNDCEMRESIGGTDATGSGTASASNELWSASRGFNNITTNMWGGEHTAQGGSWLQYDFGAGNEKAIAEVVISSGANNPDLLPKGFDIQYSSNSTTWTTAFSVSGEPNWTTNISRTYNGFSSVGALEGEYLIYDGTNWTNTSPYQVTLNSQTGTAYTLVSTDTGKYISASNALANTITVPPNSSVAFAIGTVIEVEMTGVGITTLTAGAGVTINKASTLSISGQYGVAKLIKTATDVWTAYGDLT